MSKWLYSMFAGLVAVSSFALAQAPATGLPAKTIQIIVPNAPGAGNDLVARLIAPKLSEATRHNVVVDNRPSANGILGTELVARATPDGSVLGVGNAGTHAVNASLYKKLNYDPVRDFAAITELATTSLVIVANPVVPAKSVKELIALARRSPGKINVAIAGATGEIATNALKLQGRVDMKNIPYKGGGPSVIAVVSGESDLTMTNYAAVSSLAEAGKLRIIGVTGERRNPQIPNVPTVAENGLEGYAIEMWYGLFAPAKTPPGTVQALYKEVARILNLPEVKDRLVATGHQVVASTPEQFSEKQKREVERFRKIVIESKMTQL
ncbi:MAG: Bug family tripartite tricarboxylate transporter substrate binding protein [Burkholderiales bacterium]